jgi:outer membrane biosynthesis protein TonB
VSKKGEEAPEHRLAPYASDFEVAAGAAVQRWRYEPATRNGYPVRVYFTVVVEFRVDK